MTKITSAVTRKIHDAFRFLTLNYYKDIEQYRIVYIPSRHKTNPPTDWEYKSQVELELTNDDLTEIKVYTSQYISDLLKDAEDELISNLYSIEKTDRIGYLESYKVEFYSVCRLSSIHTFKMSLKLNNWTYTQLNENDRCIIDDYLESVSTLAYQWSYKLYWREQLLRDYLPQIKVTIPPKGILLKEDTVYKILFAYDFEDIETSTDEIEDVEQSFADCKSSA